MSYPDVVMGMYRTYVPLEAPEQLRQRWWSTIIIWRIIPQCWLITITANHSNYLVCDRANTQSVTVRKCKLQLNYCNALVIKWIYNIVLFGGKNAGCSFFITFNWCICSFLTLVSDGRLQWPRLRNSWPFLLKSDVNLFNHLVRKADVAGCCSAGSVLRWHEVAPYSVSLICIVWSCFTLSWCRSINTIPASYWLFDVVWWPPRTLWYVDDNHYHFMVLPSEKKEPKTSSWSSEP